MLRIRVLGGNKRAGIGTGSARTARVRSVIHLVCHGEHPAPVPEGIIESLRAHEDEKGLHTPASLMVLDPGARLRIVGGALNDYVGIYERMTADERVILLLDLLGREVKVKLPIGAVEAA